MKPVTGGWWIVAGKKAVARGSRLVAGEAKAGAAGGCATPVMARVSHEAWREVVRRAAGTGRSRLPARRAGFTLIELMVVLAIIALLVSIVAPHYMGRLGRAEETVLRENLSVMRDALDKYYADTGLYPQSLEELVAKRYLRSVPNDPVTQSNSTWVLLPPSDAMLGAGVYDVRSGAKGTGSDGKPYEQW
jgi:type II secretion system protein G